jgi:regulator of sigma E protease
MFVGKDFTPAKINKIQTESPAEKYGLKQNDILLNIDGNKVESILDVSKFIMLSNKEFIDFVVLRSGDEYLLKVKPNKINTKDDLGNLIQKRIVGIEIGKNGDINHVKLGLVKAAYYSLNEIIFLSKKTLSMIWGFIQKIWGKGYGDLNQLGGPIKIAQITGEVAKMGVLPLIMLISFISISLGLVNLLPIPLLDGGHIMLNTIEWIRGKEFNRTTLDFAFRIGLFSLASLIIFTTLNDIRQLLAF